MKIFFHFIYSINDKKNKEISSNFHLFKIPTLFSQCPGETLRFLLLETPSIDKFV